MQPHISKQKIPSHDLAAQWEALQLRAGRSHICISERRLNNLTVVFFFVDFQFLGQMKVRPWRLPSQAMFQNYYLPKIMTHVVRASEGVVK